MVDAGSEGDARVVEHSYIYVVSDQYIEDRIDLDGVELPKQWSIAFSLQDLPGPGFRQRARGLRKLYEEIGREPELDEPTNDPVEFLERLEEWLAGETERLSYEQHQREQAEVSHELEIQEFQDEMNDWIDREGSDRLKIAHRRRYKVTSTYARERGRAELPECWIDTAGVADYRERVDPSAEALRLETRLGEWLSHADLDLSTRIVWLVEPPSGLAEALDEVSEDELFEPEFEQQEALLMAPYLGRYDAFMPVDRLHRAPTSVEQEED